MGGSGDETLQGVEQEEYSSSNEESTDTVPTVVSSCFDEMKSHYWTKVWPLTESNNNWWNIIDDTSDHIEYEEDKPNEIKCATVFKLIEKLTDDKKFDNQMLHSFLLTYNSFTNANEFMDLLIQRYNMPPPDMISISVLDFLKWKKNVLDPVRMRVSQVVKTWITHYHKYDFDETLLAKVNELVECMDTTGGEAYAKQLKQVMHKFFTDSSRNRIRTVIGQAPKVKYPSRYSRRLGVKSVDILQWPVEEIVRQLTLIEHHMFSLIEPKECLNQNWQKTKNQQNAPNIFQMISWFNKVSLYMASCILKCTVQKERVKKIDKIIRIADECRKLKNYNGLFEVLSSLQNASVHRLKEDFDLVKSSTRALYDNLVILTARDGNFKALRHEIAHVEPPSCPYLGLFLTDLTFSDDGNPDTLNGKINFSKRHKLAFIIRDLQTYHQTPYNLVEVKELKEKWLAIEPMSDDELYNQSLVICPRKSKKRRTGSVAVAASDVDTKQSSDQVVAS